MKRPLVLVPAVIVGLSAIVWAIWWFTHDRHDRDRLTLQGNIDVREVNLGFQNAGRIASLSVDEGDTIKAGQVLATLDGGYFQDAVDQARGVLREREADLARLRNGSRPEEIDQARALTAEREATRISTEADFQRNEELVHRGATSRSAYDNARSAFLQAKSQWQSALAAQRLAEIGPRQEDKDAAAAQEKQAEANLADAERHLRDTQLIAPGDGIVQTRARESGAYVNVGDTVLTVTLPNPIWVRCYVAEPDLAKVYPGMKADVVLDGSGQRFSAHVGFVSPVAEFTPKTVETRELRTDLVYRLRVIVDQPTPVLKQGMPVSVVLQLDGGGRGR